MLAVTHRLLANLFLLALLAGCASDGPEYPGDYTVQSRPAPVLPKAPPTPRPTAPSAPSAAASAPVLMGAYAYSQPLRAFIRHMMAKHGFSEAYLNALFSHAHRLDYVIRLENPAPSIGAQPSKPRLGSWTRYRNKFLTEGHINEGVAFWQENADAIRKASLIYHVDPEYIVAIIGVETYFGRNIGKTKIFDALTTLAFDTYRRSRFFTLELENYLLMAREEHLDPLEPVGSWAGAMGLGQFMPSSFRSLAVDFNQDGHRDLWHQHDAIGSVAHYFSRSGWQLHGTVASPAQKSFSPSIIELSTYTGSEYWHIYPNFKTIKRYNNSNKYAMAVHQLAQAIKQRYQNGFYPVAQQAGD